MTGEQRSLEIVIEEDSSAPEHRVLWEKSPADHPSSRPRASASGLRSAFRTLPSPPKPRSTLRMPAPVLHTTVKMARPDVSGTAASRMMPQFLAAHAHAQAQAAGIAVLPRRLPQGSGPPPLPASAALAAPVAAPVAAPAVVIRPRVAIAPAPKTFWCTLDRRLVMLADPDCARSASFRLLRDAVIAKGLPRVLAVSSAAPNEGKTTCAINLSLALAEHTGAKLLLVDANFFAPGLAEIFTIDEYEPMGPHVRVATAELSPHLAVAPFKLTALTPCLDVATIVLRRGEPLPRVDQRKLARLLGTFFRAGYDHVILDTPALEGSPAVTQLLRVADGVLVTVRAGHTTTRAIRRAVDEIGSAKTLGIALMDARS